MSLILVLSIGVSTLLLIGVQKIKHSAKESFSSSISNTDLIVGTRSGKTQLLLYSVFRQGSPLSNISWKTVQDIQDLPELKWWVPISLGDSHKGFPVIGTNSDYFKYYQYRNKQNLVFKEGRPFESAFELVLGANVAKKFNYKVLDKLYLSHGIAKSALSAHKNQPFKVVGILAATATPVDNSLHIPLSGLTAIHLSEANQTKLASEGISIDSLGATSVTALLLGLKSKLQVFSVQRKLNAWSNEAIMAIIPGVALSELWHSISTFDRAFWFITLFVTLLAFLSLLLAMLMSLQQRTRELAILRSMGAHPFQLALLLMLEALMITLVGLVFGLGLLGMTAFFFKNMIEEFSGLMLSFSTLSFLEIKLLFFMIVGALLMSLLPAYLAYKKALAEGFSSL